jgi:hypothetical protein
MVKLRRVRCADRTTRIRCTLSNAGDREVLLFGKALSPKRVFVDGCCVRRAKDSSEEAEFAGFLFQLLVIGGIVSLLLLLAGVVSWRVRRAGRYRPK